jgi:hypothetical protein
VAKVNRVTSAIVRSSPGFGTLGCMAAPPSFVMKTETEYRVGSPDGELQRADRTTAVKLVSFKDGHAVCESNGKRIFIESMAALLTPRLRSRRR